MQSNWVSLDEVVGLEVGAVFVDDVKRFSVESCRYYCITRIAKRSDGSIDFIESLAQTNQGDSTHYSTTTHSDLIDLNYFRLVTDPDQITKVRLECQQYAATRVEAAFAEAQSWVDIRRTINKSTFRE
jgi:hypothetical protein